MRIVLKTYKSQPPQIPARCRHCKKDTNMRYITILLALIFTSGLFAQTDKLTIDSKDFVSKKIKIFEPNPIHEDISINIDNRFHAMLSCFPDCKLDTSLLIRLLIENSVTKYEDSQDRYRYSIRRCLIFTMFSMSVAPDKADLYIDLAENSLLDSENRIDENLVDIYSGILILDLLIKDSNKTLYSNDLKRIKDEYRKLETSIDKPDYDKGLQIIEKIEMK